MNGHEIERIGAAGDRGTRAPDHALDRGDEQARHRDGREQKADPHHDRRQHALRKARQHRRQRCEQQEHDPDRPQEPPRLAVVGDVVEERNDPARQPLRGLNHRRIDKGHAQEQHDDGDRGGDGKLARRNPRLARVNARRTDEDRQR